MFEPCERETLQDLADQFQGIQAIEGTREIHEQSSERVMPLSIRYRLSLSLAWRLLRREERCNNE